LVLFARLAGTLGFGRRTARTFGLARTAGAFRFFLTTGAFPATYAARTFGGARALFVFALGRKAALAGGGFVVGGVPARALENNSGGSQNFAQAVLAALGAALEGFIAKGLMALELHTAAFTPISIDRHSDSLSEQRVIIALFAGRDKTLAWRLYR